MTKVEIIEETANFYTTKNRAYKDGGCLYFIDGKSCGVGRCMVNPKHFQSKLKHKFVSISTVCENNIDDELKSEYKGCGIGFWGDIQGFHDREEFWNGSGLSEEGKERKQQLIEKYK